MVSSGAAVVSSTAAADVVAAAVGAGVAGEEAAVVGLTVVAPSSPSPPQPWIAKKALNARRESTNARPVILKIANSHFEQTEALVIFHTETESLLFAFTREQFEIK